MCTLMLINRLEQMRETSRRLLLSPSYGQEAEELFERYTLIYDPENSHVIPRLMVLVVLVLFFLANPSYC